MRRATIAAGLAALVVTATSTAFGRQDDFDAFIARPTPEHEALKAEVGTWDAKVKFFMAGPDAPPEVSDAVETSRMLGDLWLVGEFQGSFGGRPYTGQSQIGFDAKADRYVMTWIDSMSTTMMTLTGTFDPSTKTLTMTGKAFDPMLNKEVEQKVEVTHVDEDHQTFALSMKAPEFGDDWVKGLEIDYTRRKDGTKK